MRRNFRIITIVILLNILVSALICKSYATEQGTLSIKLISNTSEAISNKKVYIEIKLSDFSKVDTTQPMALQGNLTYDNQIFKNATIEGKNGWSADINSSNKILLDADKVTENNIIATVTLFLNNNITNEQATIGINNIEITNGENVNLSNIKVDTIINISKNLDNNQNIINEFANLTENTTTNTTENTTNEEVNNSNEILNTVINNNNNEKENQNIISVVNKIEKVDDITIKEKDLPQTGEKSRIFIIISLILLIAGVISFIRYKKFYD